MGRDASRSDPAEPGAPGSAAAGAAAAPGAGGPAPHRGSTFVRNSAAIALGQYAARGMVLARGWAAAVALGPSGFGVWNALNLIYDYGSYATLGALQGLDLTLPPAVAEADAPRARRLMAGAWSVVLAGAAAFAALVVTAAWLGVRTAAAADPRLMLLMLAAALLQLAFQYFATALRAHGRFGAVSAGQVTQAAAGAGLGLALVFRFGLWGLLWGWLLGTLAALAGMRRACPEAPLSPAHPACGVKLARLGLPIFAYYLASLVLRSVDRLALVRYGDARSLGLYGVALMATGLVLFVPEAVAYVLFPRIAAAYHGSADRSRVRADVLRVQRALAVVMPLGVGLAIVWAGPLVEWLLPAYRNAVPALRWLATGALALSAAIVPSYFLLGCGRQHSLLGLGAVAAAVNAALVFGVARARPEPASVAVAAIVARASMELAERAGARALFALASLLPAAWGAAAALAAVALLPRRGALAALEATAAFAVLYVPLMIALARGLGMRKLARETLAGGAKPPA